MPHNDSSLPATTATTITEELDTSNGHQDFEITCSEKKLEELEEPEDVSSPSGKRLNIDEDVVNPSIFALKDDLPKQNPQNSNDTTPLSHEDYSEKNTLNPQPPIQDPNNAQANAQALAKIHQNLAQLKEPPSETPSQLSKIHQTLKELNQKLELGHLDTRPDDERQYHCIDDPPSESPRVYLGSGMLGGHVYVDIATGARISVSIGCDLGGSWADKYTKMELAALYMEIEDLPMVNEDYEDYEDDV